MYPITKNNLIMRKDKNRIVAYFKASGHIERLDGSENEKFYILSPVIALCFYLMNGTRTLDEILDYVTDYFDRGDLFDPDSNNEDIPEDEKVDMREMIIELLNTTYDEFFDEIEEKKKREEYVLRDVFPDMKTAKDIDEVRSYLYTPNFLLILPTMKCLANCNYCYAKRDIPTTVSIDKWIEIINDCKNKYKMRKVEISGGDVFQYEPWRDLIKALADNDFYPELPTKTPLKFEDQQYIKKLGFESYQISLDSLNPKSQKTSLNINNSEQYVTDIIESIKNAQSIDLKISVNCVINKNTYSDVLDLYQKLVKFDNVYSINFGSVSYSRYTKSEVEEYALSISMKEELENECEKIKKLNKESNNYPRITLEPAAFKYYNAPSEDNEFTMQEFLNKRIICSGMRSSLTILPNGDVTGCEELYDVPVCIIGNINDSTLEQIFDSPRRWELLNEDRTSLEDDNPCKTCDIDIYNHCTGFFGRCWRDSLYRYGTAFGPESDCPLSKEYKANHSNPNYF